MYEECEDQLISELKGQNVTIIQDGWSNVHNHPVIGHPLTGWLHTFDHDAITFQLLQHAYIMETKLYLTKIKRTLFLRTNETFSKKDY